MFLDNAATKSNILERSWTNFNQAEFVMNYFNKDWSNILNRKHGDVNKSNLSKYINIYNYSIELTPAESQAGGTLLYTNNKLSYKNRQDLCIYKSSELESTSIEIINKKSKQI